MFIWTVDAAPQIVDDVAASDHGDVVFEKAGESAAEVHVALERLQRVDRQLYTGTSTA